MPLTLKDIWYFYRRKVESRKNHVPGINSAKEC